MQSFDNLIPVDSALVRLASITCAAAFMDDPYTEYEIPNKKYRPNLKYGFEYFLRMSVLGKARIYATSQKCEGVAVWQDSLDRDGIRFAFGVNPLLPFRCGWLFIVRELSINRLADKIKKKYAPEHHIYLSLLAVHPESQGKGFAGRLLMPMLTEANKIRLPVYLETQNLKNVAMYQHFGFKLIHEFSIPHTEMEMYSMLKE
jgi:GNAT superfamily N-acetyltransferase